MILGLEPLLIPPEVDQDFYLYAPYLNLKLIASAIITYLRAL